MSDLQQKLLSIFHGECRDHLSAVRGALDTLEAAQWNCEEINFTEMHRRVHSLKGAARAVDIKPIEKIAHCLETAVEACRIGEVVITDANAMVIREALDAIEDCAQSVEQGQTASISADLILNVEKLYSGGADTVDEKHTEPAHPIGMPVSDSVNIEEKAQEDAMAPAVIVENRAAVATNPLGNAKESIRVEIGVLDGLIDWTGEFLTVTTTHDRMVEESRDLEQEVDEVVRNLYALRGVIERSDHKLFSDANADVSRAFHLIDSDLKKVLMRSRNLQGVQSEITWKVKTMATKLEGHVKRARMVQIESVLGNIRKIVRDLANEEGKSVRVDARGLDIVADRWVVQALKDPIIHILRNSVSHGTETSAERERAGKTPQANVIIRFSQERENLMITIEDDGRGIDTVNVFNKARAMGIEVHEEENSQNIMNLLTRPNFSTASEITEISGRGLGLSIVKEAVVRLGGELQFESQPDMGTKFIIRVPIAVSSQSLIFTMFGENTYCIPTRGVERVLQFAQSDIRTVEGKTVLAVGDDESIPAMTLAAALDEDFPAQSDENQKITALVLKSAVGRCALIVDSVSAVRDGLIRDLGLAIAGVDLVTGGVVLESGNVAPVLNVVRLVELVHNRAPALRVVRKEKTKQIFSILVVDDSITTRTLEKSILEANGYRVRLSIDGVDALEQLRLEKVDLIVTDVEMPRMDGFGLVHAIKSDDSLANIPVILVTSRDSEEDRRKGLRLGAEAYVIKQRFDQTALLESIGQLL